MKHRFFVLLFLLPLSNALAYPTNAEKLKAIQDPEWARSHPEVFWDRLLNGDPRETRKRLTPDDKPPCLINLRGLCEVDNPRNYFVAKEKLVVERLQAEGQTWDGLFSPPFPQFGYYDYDRTVTNREDNACSDEPDPDGDWDEDFDVIDFPWVSKPEWTASSTIGNLLAFDLTNSFARLEALSPARFAACFHEGNVGYAVTRRGNRRALAWMESRGFVDTSALGISGCSIVFGAVESGDRKLLEYVLERYGTNLVDRPTALGYTPLMLAVRGDFYARGADLASMLLDRGANANATIPKTGETPLHLACLQSLEDDPKVATSVEIVRLLLDRGADPTLRDRNGRNVLEYARANKAPREIIRVLRDRLGAGPTEEEARAEDTEKRTSAMNDAFSKPELAPGVVAGLARMSAEAGEDVVWRDACLRFLGRALARPDGVAEEDRALAREKLVSALSFTNATLAGTALVSLQCIAPDARFVSTNALRIVLAPAYSCESRATALLVWDNCVRADPSILADPLPDSLSPEWPFTPKNAREAIEWIPVDPSSSLQLRATAEGVLIRLAPLF